MEPKPPKKLVSIRVKVPNDLHRNFKVHCIQEGTTMDAYLKARIEEAVAP